ncbi:MAG: hypothetical protein AAFP02_12620 [Bacteroidota bacterium]
MNLLLQTLRQTFLLTLLICGTLFVQAQSFNQLYPTLTLVSANENTNNAIYRISKAGTDYRVSIGINGNNAGFVIQTQADGVIGQATSSLSGSCEVISVTKTQKGLLDLWQFAMDRVIVNNGALALFGASASSSNSALVQHFCEEKCDDQLEQAITVDNKANKTFYKAISIPGVGNGTCDGYIPCTASILQSYEDCVCECVEDKME